MADSSPLNKPLLGQQSPTKQSSSGKEDDLKAGRFLSPSSSFPSRGGVYRIIPHGSKGQPGAPGEGNSGAFVLEEKTVVDYNYIMEEAKTQILIAGPMVLVNLLQYSILLVSTVFAGHLGKLELASSSLANSIASVLGFYILLGMASALETLCGRAYGAEQYHMLGIYLQRGLVVLCAVCIPLTFLFLYMENVLLLFGQTAEISAKAGEYAIWLLPALYAYAFLQPITKFLQTQSVVVPMAVCSGATLIIHVGLCWFIIHKIGLGFPGAALATSISYWLNVLLLFLYVKLTGVCKTTWGDGLSSKQAFTELGTFSRMALSSAVMICLEYWCFEVMVMLAGWLPNPQLELSALSVCLNTVTLNYMIPFGLSAAASTRVSNELGAGKPVAARTSVYVVVGISMLQATVISVSLLSARHVWGWVFSNELEVVEYVSTIMPIIAYLALCDGIQGVLSGVARGAGWQDLGAFVNLCTFYGVGVPVGVLLTFKFDWGGKGIFTGLVTGLGLQMLTLAIITFRTDWVKQAQMASSLQVHGSKAGLGDPEKALVEDGFQKV